MYKDLLNPDKALIFRIVHKNNIDNILSNGCQSRSAAISVAGYVEIGNQELIQRRSSRIVPCGPGGTLSEYVPFYFTPFTPMIYNIKTGYGVPRRPLEDILILVSSLHKLEKIDHSFVFSDRHAYLKTANFYDDVVHLAKIIWPVLQARDFRKDDVEKFEKYQAEALVHWHLPVSGLIGIGCYDAQTRDEVSVLAGERQVDVNVIVQKKWYL